VSYEELRNASEEKDATILELQQAAEITRADLEMEKKQVEGKSSSRSFVCRLDSPRSALDLFIFCFQACGPLSGRRRRKRRRSKWPTTPPSRNWRFCRRQPSRRA
jgi:hypothetical protein